MPTEIQKELHSWLYAMRNTEFSSAGAVFPAVRVISPLLQRIVARGPIWHLPSKLQSALYRMADWCDPCSPQVVVNETASTFLNDGVRSDVVAAIVYAHTWGNPHVDRQNRWWMGLLKDCDFAETLRCQESKWLDWTQAAMPMYTTVSSDGKSTGVDECQSLFGHLKARFLQSGPAFHQLSSFAKGTKLPPGPSEAWLQQADRIYFGRMEDVRDRELVSHLSSINNPFYRGWLCHKSAVLRAEVNRAFPAEGEVGGMEETAMPDGDLNGDAVLSPWMIVDCCGDAMREVFEVEMSSWRYAINHYPGDMTFSQLHELIRRMAPMFRDMICHGQAFDVLDVAAQLSKAAKYLIHEKEIAFSICMRFPDSNDLGGALASGPTIVKRRRRRRRRRRTLTSEDNPFEQQVDTDINPFAAKLDSEIEDEPNKDLANDKASDQIVHTWDETAANTALTQMNQQIEDKYGGLLGRLVKR